MGSSGLLVQLGADKVVPLVEHALQPEPGQPLTSAFEEELPLMLLL